MNAHATSESLVVESLLSAHGRTLCSELDIDVAANTPSGLFRLFTVALLIDRGLGYDAALAAARALADHGWGTADRLATCRREDLRRVLRSGVCLQHTSDVAETLKAATGTLLESYQGDLRTLRDGAGYDPQIERARLLAFEGMGDSGADVFFQEVQIGWDEVYPFAGSAALATAAHLGLPETAGGLAALTSGSTFPRLVAALIRSESTACALQAPSARAA